jgi:hypothetical protein
MNHRQVFAADDRGLISGSFVEAIWETGIAVATAAAVCVGIVNLASHLDAAREARTAVADAAPADHLAPTELANGYEPLRFN